MIDLTTDFGQAVERHLKEEYVIWLTTVDFYMTPQPRPVWPSNRLPSGRKHGRMTPDEKPQAKGMAPP
jgi:hypothetical protein